MALPILAALIGGLGSVAGSVIGGQAQSQATQYNWAANERNLQARERERDEARQYAEQLRREDKLGSTDALGNRQRFVEGRGWVTDVAPEIQQLLDHMFGSELPERQAQFMRRADQSRDADDLLSTLMDEFRRIQRGNPVDAERELYAASTRGIDDATESALRVAMRDSLRSGSSNAGQIASAIGRQGMNSRAAAGQQAHLEARDYTDNRYAGQRGQQQALMQAMAAMAGADLGMSYDPTGMANTATQQQNVAAQRGGASDAAGLQAVMMQGGTLNPIQPDYGMANAIMGATSGLTGAADRVAGASGQRRAEDMLMQYITAGGQFDMTRGGLYGAMADRVRPGAGLF